MIRINKPVTGPRILSGPNNRGPKTTAKLKKEFDQGKRDFEFVSSIYGAKSVKSKLIEIQHGKCCFCESRFPHIAFGDVEHWRPKGGFKQKDGESLIQPGYYWLAYDWANLFASCSLCNQRFKKNLFPLVDPGKRARSHHDDLNFERPFLAHPSDDDPELLISFHKELPIGIDDGGRGKTTIDILGLDRDELMDMRQDRLSAAELIRETVVVLRERKQNSGALTPDLQRLLERNELALQKREHPSTEYRAMLRANGIIGNS